MTDTLINQRPSAAMSSGALQLIALTVVAWAGLILALAAQGTFDVPASDPALPTLLALTVPVALFAMAMAAAPRLRTYAMSLDPVLLTNLQAWRILGGLFLAVYAFGHLPAFFAWPAGFGDVAVGIAAPFAALPLSRNSSVLQSRGFRTFHFLGLADFAVAFTTGLAARNAIPGLVTDVTTTPMGQLPLVLIPTLAVPAFIILHLIVLMQSFARR